MTILALLSTIFCFAVNAYTYRVAYPLWREADPASFPRIHAAYLRLLTPVITLPHIAMFFSTAAIAFNPAPWLPRPAAMTVFTLGTLVILLSILVAAPIHDRFTRNAAADPAGLERLIHLSALRTALMTIATAILLTHLTPPRPIDRPNPLQSHLERRSNLCMTWSTAN